MLPKKHRADRLLFGRAGLGKSRLLSSRLFSLRVYNLPTGQPTSDRFAVVVSKKAAAKAVKRNLIRRIAYSSIKDSGFLAKRMGFFIFMAKKGVDQAGRREIREDVCSLLRSVSV